MIVYKLTDADLRTRNGYQWTPGVPQTTNGRGDLCGPGWLHAYRDPLLAVLFAPAHVSASYTQLWEAEAVGDILDDGTKIGVTRLTLLREIERPVVTTAQRVRWAILCAWEVCDEPNWRAWATAWLDGSDRSERAAVAAAAAAAAAEAAEAAEATWAATWATRAATRATWAATWATWAATRATWAATWATRAATRATWVAPLDLLALARRAVAEGAA